MSLLRKHWPSALQFVAESLIDITVSVTRSGGWDDTRSPEQRAGELDVMRELKDIIQRLRAVADWLDERPRVEPWTP